MPETNERWSEYRARVVTRLLEEGPQLRADLERARGKRSIKKQIDRLVENGTIEETADGHVKLPASRTQALGIYIGYARVRIAVTDISGEPLYQEQLEPMNYRKYDFRWLLGQIRDAVKRSLEKAEKEVDGELRLCGTGVALPTLVDPETDGGCLAATYPATWSEEKLTESFIERLGPFVGRRKPVFFATDATADLMAEVRHGDRTGARRGDDAHLLVVKCSGNISAAFWDGTRVHRGTGPGAGGLGHVVADLQDLDSTVEGVLPLSDLRTDCACGHEGGHPRPHLEQVAGGRAIADRIGVRAEHPEDAVSYRQALDARLSKLRDDPTGTSEPELRCAVSQAGAVLGRAIDGATATLSPSKVILTGFLSGAGEVLKQAVDDEMQGSDIRKRPHRPTVVLGTGYDDERQARLGAQGAALLVLREVAHPALFEELRHHGKEPA